MSNDALRRAYRKVKVVPRCDLTTLEVGAIVNASNPGLRRGGGVCGAIFEAAGSVNLQRACDAVSPCPVGEARITPGFALPAQYVIHTVGPCVHGAPNVDDARLLGSCYRSALDLAKANGIRAVAFPCISTGIYGYPKRKAAVVALEAVRDWLLRDGNSDSMDEIVLSTFQREDSDM